MLGSLGQIIFSVSEESVKTFSELNFSRKNNFAEHKILNGKGLIEFTGQDAATCSLRISLHENLGLDPQSELEKLREIFNNHEVVNFMLGEKVYGEWVIESMSENLSTIGATGKLIAAKVDLNLKEYILE